MGLTVFITGATAGFGRATARRLVADGHRVVATGRRAERLAALGAELGTKLLGVTLDVTDREAVAALPGSLPEGWRDIDVLVANAGLALGLGPAWECKPSDWTRWPPTAAACWVRCGRGCPAWARATAAMW